MKILSIPIKSDFDLFFLTEVKFNPKQNHFSQQYWETSLRRALSTLRAGAVLALQCSRSLLTARKPSAKFVLSCGSEQGIGKCFLWPLCLKKFKKLTVSWAALGFIYGMGGLCVEAIKSLIL